MADETGVEERNKRDRSPSFPFISLEKAIERAEAFALNHKKQAARISAIAGTWRYGLKSSGLIQTLAALKQYGLIEDIGGGEERKAQLSELAWRILMDSRPGARERAIRDAAMKPRLLAEYIAKWIPDRPSDSHCLSELHLDRGFNPEAAKAFLRVFDDNAAFAKLDESDSMSLIPREAPSMEELDALEEASGHGSYSPQQTRALANQVRLLQAARSPSPKATLPLKEGIVVLELPSPLSKRSIKALKSWLALMIDMAENTDDAEEPNSVPE